MTTQSDNAEKIQPDAEKQEQNAVENAPVADEALDAVSGGAQSLPKDLIKTQVNDTFGDLHLRRR